MTGTEVERIDVVGPPAPDNFVIGKVTEAVQHPDADRLRVCTVDVGEDGPRTIVCGAPNVGAGQTVAVALPGARMPGGEKLRKAKLRGVASEGMILAADEIEIGDEHDGIMVLDDALAAGTPLAEIVPLAEPVLEIEVTPNRSDCFGVYGVAREVHAVTGGGARARAVGGRARPPRAPARPRTSPRSRSRSPTSARASPPASSPTSRSAPRRSGCRSGSRRRASGRSPTSSTSPTT